MVQFMRSLEVRKLVAALAVLSGMLLAGPVSAQNLKVGYVSVPRLLQESPQAKSAMESLEQEFAPKARAIQAKEKDFQEKTDRIQRDLQVMSDAEKRNAEKDLREDQREIARLRNEFVEDQNLRRNEELATLQRSLLQQVDEFARSGNYDMIIGDGVLFANSAVNVTDEILAAMQQNFGSAK